MKQIKIFTLPFIITLTILFLSKEVRAHWYNDGYGYVSNICRSYDNMYWQVVPYHYVDTKCYMPGWGVYGRRTLE